MVDNPKMAFGNAKPCVRYLPMRILMGVARVMRTGAIKYGVKNWRVQPVAASTYYDAAMRHMIDWFEGPEGILTEPQDLDPESGESHLDHAIANLMILRDGMGVKGFIDDRKLAEALTKNQ